MPLKLFWIQSHITIMQNFWIIEIKKALIKLLSVAKYHLFISYLVRTHCIPGVSLSQHNLGNQFCAPLLDVKKVQIIEKVINWIILHLQIWHEPCHTLGQNMPILSKFNTELKVLIIQSTGQVLLPMFTYESHICS